MKKLNVDCVILAAGLSSRMGTWKMGLPYKKTTILQHTVSTALAACQNVIVVVGQHEHQAKKLLSPFPNISVRFNQNFRKGQFNSAKIGIQSVQSEHFFITLGDLPLIETSIYHQVYKQLSQAEEKVIFPSYQMKQGHPVLIHSSLIPHILRQPDTSSMKKILQQFPTRYLNVDTPEIVSDIDTPKEYKNILIKQR